MGEVVRPSLFQETVPEFIRRHGYVANTVNVAHRFGWPVNYARMKLNELVDAGELVAIGLGGAEGSVQVLSWAIAGWDWDDARHLGRQGFMRTCPFCPGWVNFPTFPHTCTCGALWLPNYECVRLLT